MWDSKKSIFTLSELREVLSNDSSWVSNKNNIKKEFLTTVTSGSPLSGIAPVGQDVITEISYNGDIKHTPTLKSTVGYYYASNGYSNVDIAMKNPARLSPSAGGNNLFDSWLPLPSGYPPGIESVGSSILKMIFSSDTNTTLTSKMVVPRDMVDGYSSDTYGYLSGGTSSIYGLVPWEQYHPSLWIAGPASYVPRSSVTPVNISLTEKLNYATDSTSSSPSSNLIVSRKGASATSNSSYGYVINGAPEAAMVESIAKLSTIETLFFSSGTFNLVPTTGITQRHVAFSASLNSGPICYFVGGNEDLFYHEYDWDVPASTRSGQSGQYTSSTTDVRKLIFSTNTMGYQPGASTPDGYIRGKIEGSTNGYFSYGGVHHTDSVNGGTIGGNTAWYATKGIALPGKYSSNIGKLNYSTTTITSIPAPSTAINLMGGKSHGYAQTSLKFVLSTDTFSPISAPIYGSSVTTVCNEMGSLTQYLSFPQINPNPLPVS